MLHQTFRIMQRTFFTKNSYGVFLVGTGIRSKPLFRPFDLNSHGYRKIETLAETSMVWIDMEMTGLDVMREKIMEIACIITDKDMNVMAEAPDFILKVK